MHFYIYRVEARHENFLAYLLTNEINATGTLYLIFVLRQSQGRLAGSRYRKISMIYYTTVYLSSILYDCNPASMYCTIAIHGVKPAPATLCTLYAYKNTRRAGWLATYMLQLASSYSGVATVVARWHYW